MTGRRKFGLTVGLIVISALAIELGVWWLRRPVNAVRVVNGGAPVRNLIASYAGVETYIGDLPAGGSTEIRLDNRPEDAVTLAFTQEGNAATGVLIGGEELHQARRDGLRMVLVLKPNEISRYLEEDASSDEPSPLLRLVRRVVARIRPEF
ncbi:hypothetical protein [Planctomyces sp. SH-PL62]|uniref:hypothetical protein n=1 Tax=Planctomyces sp. SH-PL62 TaxID=1636152 RepID=UPI00078E410D|nr:hypothetical protein [Planctomyces sp. SH-PL62]AMV37457.1 hypothetical protein VT85_08480 [Planctomyces sp. SH-PL62]